MFKQLVQAGSDAFFALVSPSVSRNLGTGKAVWNASDKMARMFPITIQTSGEITEGTIAAMQENAKKMTEQAKLWTDYSGAASEYVQGYAETVVAKSSVGVAMAGARTMIAEAEKDLGFAVIDAEMKIRKSHKQMAQAQAKLSMPDMLHAAIYAPAQHNKNTDGGLVGRYNEKMAA
ncbi:MAG: hypothetical protein PUP93_26835 [Rhizonema sp. NSF051]|nr:hypothetical protein [Rhizonema sp. NSF051]